MQLLTRNKEKKKSITQLVLQRQWYQTYKPYTNTEEKSLSNGLKMSKLKKSLRQDAKLHRKHEAINVSDSHFHLL